jgi:hypothetical protein
MALLNGLFAPLSDYPPVSATLVTLLVLVFADVVLAIAAALKTHTFNARRVADFIGGDLLRVVVVLAFGLGAAVNAYIASAFYLSGAALATSVVAKINANFKVVFGVDPQLPPPPMPPK